MINSIFSLYIYTESVKHMNLNLKKDRYADWFQDTWNETGGLVSAWTAAKILEVSKGRISQIWKEKNFKKYKFSEKDRALLAIKDVLLIYFKKQ